jgi:hypothetical protein
MKPLPPSPQLNLPLVNLSACIVPTDKQPELILALVELLIGAAHVAINDRNEGGDNDHETHR